MLKTRESFSHTGHRDVHLRNLTLLAHTDSLCSNGLVEVVKDWRLVKANVVHIVFM